MSTTTAVVEKKKSVYSEMVEITPEYAQELLKNNKINRPISQRSVRHYAQQMVKGDWCSETDESIKVSVNKMLLDGQHRLNAIVYGNKAVKMRVTYNLPDEIFHYIDQGKKRTAKDVLHIAGVPNSGAIAGIIKAAIVMQTGALIDASAVQTQLSNEDIYQVYEKKPQYWQDVFGKTQRWYKAFHHVLTPSFLAAHFCTFGDLNIEAAEQFMEKLCTGIGLGANDPVRVLREYYLRQLDLKGKKANTTSYLSAVMIKGWNAYRQNKEVTQLKWDSSREAYPIAI